MRQLKVGFAGTPEFARHALQAILAAGYQVPVVLTQPDRAAGRGIWRAGHPTDYAAVFAQWIPQRNACRPNPFRNQPYCR